MTEQRVSDELLAMMLEDKFYRTDENVLGALKDAQADRAALKTALNREAALKAEIERLAYLNKRLQDVLDNKASYEKLWAEEAEKREAAEARNRALVEALRAAIKVAREAHKEWDADNDPRVGKLLMALAGYVKGYRADIDGIHAALSALQAGEEAK